MSETCSTPTPAPASPFQDIQALLVDLPQADEACVEMTAARNAQLIKPQGALGRLEDIVSWLAGWTGRTPPMVTRPIVAVFASDHGVADQNVSAYPQIVTRQMIDAIAAGGAAISVLAQQAGAGLKVYDLAVGRPTPDISQQAAMSEQECVATMAYGMEVLAEGTDLLVLGEVGIANTTVAAALAHALYGGAPTDWVGEGTGIGRDGMALKAAVVAKAVARVSGTDPSPLALLAEIGGREFAAIAGAILAARLQRIPVVLDGYSVCVAAAVLHKVNPRALDHCIVGHVSGERGHGHVLDRLGKKPLLDLGMRLGEGSGAALALNIIKAACACHAGMATFGEAGVSGPSQ